jgi:ATP-dependent protease HslVU (ClpYQ) peptidase subunit
MSFVSVIAGVDFLSIMTDGRVTLGETVWQEDYPKYKKINDKIVIGYAGHKEHIELLLNSLNYSVVSEGNLLFCAKSIKQAINEFNFFRDSKMVFILGGINANEQIEFVIVSTNNEDIEQFIPEHSEAQLLSCYAFNLKDAVISQHDLNTKLYEFIEVENNHLVNAQKRLHEFVADNDFSCNKTIFHEVIKKIS